MHLLVVCTAERGLCGAFNSSIVRLAREHANRLAAEGKTVKFLCVGRKGFEQLRRQYEKQIVEVIELRSVRSIGFVQCRGRRESASSRCSTRAQFDVATLFFSRFKSVIAQIPTAQQIIPPVFEARGRRRRVGVLRIRAGGSRYPRRAAAAQHRRAGIPRAAWKTPRPSRARA